MVLQHVLFAIILVGVPVLNLYGMSKLKAEIESAEDDQAQLEKRSRQISSKLKVYIITIFCLWVLTGIVWLVSSPRQMFYFNGSLEVGLLGHIVMIVFVFYMVVTTIVPLFLLRSSKFRNEALAAFKENHFILPTIKLEKILFILVAVSVGICEEVIFRAFLVNYLHNELFGLLTSFIVAGLIFGLGHFHQGVNGIINATVFGMVMSYLFIMTGSLLLPIIIHIVYDLKILILSRLSTIEKVTST